MAYALKPHDILGSNPACAFALDEFEVVRQLSYHCFVVPCSVSNDVVYFFALKSVREETDGPLLGSGVRHVLPLLGSE